MAKASGINKKLLAKKDMNFFAEFTANAARAARLLGYAVAAGFLVLFVVLGLIVALFIRNTIIKGQIKQMKDLLAGPDYASLEADAALLTEELNSMSNYYYALTQMRRNVDIIDAAPTDLPDVLAKCIPSDSFISSYSISNSQLNISGYSFTYYSAVDMVNMLNEKDVFTARPLITSDRVDHVAESDFDEILAGGSVDAINTYYQFQITGTLISNVHIAISRYLEGETLISLGGVETLDVRAGDPYTIDGINEYTYAGTTYYLTRILVNGVQVEDGSFGLIQANNQYADVGRGNYEIRLYYTATAPAAEG